MALSGRGRLEWPPLLRTVKWNVWKVFSAVCRPNPSGVPLARKAPPPPSELSAYSASVSWRHSVAPSRAPLPPVSSSPVKNRMRSRFGFQPACLELEERHDQPGHPGLVVVAAAAVEIAAFLEEFERVVLPVRALGLNHIHMRHQQDRLGGRLVGPPAGDQRDRLVAGLALIGHDLDVRFRQSRRPAARRRSGRPAAAPARCPTTVGISTDFS